MSKGNIKIAGDGFINEGKYNTIKIMGSAISKGNVESEEVKISGDARFIGELDFGILKVNGDATIEGNLKAKRIRVNGNLEISGSCQVDELVINGSCSINCDLKCNNVTVRGEIIVNRDMYGKEIKIYGESSIKENIECENIMVEGVINCNGLLNAENIEIYTRGKSYCKEIGATKIRILKEKERKLLKLIMNFRGHGKLKSDLIEGDYIELENSIVKNLRGKSIELISNCEVGMVEYSEKINVSDDSIVKHSMKVS